MLEIEYTFGEQDLVHFNEACYLKTDEYRDDMRKNRLIIPAIIMLISAFYYYYYHDVQTSFYIVLMALLWAFVIPRTIMSRWRRKVLQSYNEKEKANLFGQYKLTIDPTQPQFLHEKSPSGKNKMLWADLVRVEYGKRYVYIYLDLNVALVIPVDGVTKGNLEEFAEQAQKMIDRYS